MLIYDAGTETRHLVFVAFRHQEMPTTHRALALTGIFLHTYRDGVTSQMSLLLNSAVAVCWTFASLQQMSGVFAQFALLHTVAGCERT